MPADTLENRYEFVLLFDVRTATPTATPTVLRFVLARGIVGMIEASATKHARRRPVPRPRELTTVPIAQVPVGWKMPRTSRRKIGVERGVIAGAEFASAAGLLGKRAHELETAREAIEVVPFGEEAVVDGGGNPRVRGSAV